MKNIYILTVVIFLLIPYLSLADETELSYDDGNPYIPNYHLESGDAWAVRFTPPFIPGYIKEVKIYIKSATDELHSCFIAIYNDFEGYPNEELWVKKFDNYTNDYWNFYNIDYFPWEQSEDFYIVYIQAGYYPDCDGVYCDPEMYEPRSYKRVDGVWSLFSTEDKGDLLIRCIYSDNNAILNSSIGVIRCLYK